MSRACSLLLCLLATAALGQVRIAKQPDVGALEAALEAARGKRPTDAKALLSVKQGPIAPSLEKDLLELDWLQVGGWSYPEKQFDPTYLKDAISQYDVERQLPDGGVLRFSLLVVAGQRAKSEVRHLNFELPPKVRVAVEKVGKETYLAVTAYGEKELHRVVSYADGVLVLDISYDGKPRSKQVKFREVRIAVPRLFESSGT